MNVTYILLAALVAGLLALSVARFATRSRRGAARNRGRRRTITAAGRPARDLADCLRREKQIVRSAVSKSLRSAPGEGSARVNGGARPGRERGNILALRRHDERGPHAARRLFGVAGKEPSRGKMQRVRAARRAKNSHSLPDGARMGRIDIKDVKRPWGW